MKSAWVHAIVLWGLLAWAPGAWACADGIEVRFNPERPAQGSVVLVEVRTAPPLILRPVSVE